MQDEQEISDGSIEYIYTEEKMVPRKYEQLNYNKPSNEKNRYKKLGLSPEDEIKNYGEIKLINNGSNIKAQNQPVSIVTELNDLVGDVERELINSGNYVEQTQSNADVEEEEIEDTNPNFGSHQYYSNKDECSESQEFVQYEGQDRRQYGESQEFEQYNDQDRRQYGESQEFIQYEGQDRRQYGESQEFIQYDDQDSEAEHPYQNFDIQNNRNSSKVNNVNIGQLLDDITLNQVKYKRN